MLRIQRIDDESSHVAVEEPRLVQILFQSTGTEVALGWLLVRVWVGWQWVQMGWQDLSEPGRLESLGRVTLAHWIAWSDSVGAETGAFERWQAPFYQSLADVHAESLVPGLLAAAQISAGLAVALGGFVGIFAAFGTLASLTGIMVTGSSGAGPVVALPAVLLVLAWRNAGHLGLDRYLLRAFGAPWWDTTVGYRPGRRHWW